IFYCMSISPIITVTQAQNEDIPGPIKNPRLEEPRILLPEVWTIIARYLPIKEILAFEAASKGHREYTASRWKELAIEDRLDFHWESCVSESYPQRARYLLGAATYRYIEERQKVKSAPTIEKVQALYVRLEKTMLQFPYFGAFVWNDLRR